MSEPPRRSLLSLVLFWLTLALATSLILLVILAPVVDNREGGTTTRAREDLGAWVAVFAQDAVVRRTAVASALGLAVTAWVFFRRPGRSNSQSRSKPPRLPPPANMAGA
jgi:hypothetical protein